MEKTKSTKNESESILHQLLNTTKDSDNPDSIWMKEKVRKEKIAELLEIEDAASILNLFSEILDDLKLSESKKHISILQKCLVKYQHEILDFITLK